MILLEKNCMFVPKYFNQSIPDFFRTIQFLINSSMNGIYKLENEKQGPSADSREAKLTNQQKINLNCVSIQLRKYVVFDSANKAHSVHQVIKKSHS